MNQADEAFRKAYHARYNARCWAPSAFVGDDYGDKPPLLVLSSELPFPLKAAADLTVALFIRCMHPSPSA